VNKIGEAIAIDGKTLRYSYDRGAEKGAIHMVSMTKKVGAIHELPLLFLILFVQQSFENRYNSGKGVFTQDLRSEFLNSHLPFLLQKSAKPTKPVAILNYGDDCRCEYLARHQSCLTQFSP
jgi:hypothetical protein